MKKIFLLVSSVLLLNGCAAILLGGGAAGGYYVAKNKSAGQYVSDSMITTKAKSKFALDDHIKGRNISVSTEGGTVYLTGEASLANKQRAIRLASKVDGVKGVNASNLH